MRVLVLSHMFPSDQRPVFGIFVHEQVQALRKQGVDVAVLSPVPWTPRIALLPKHWRLYRATPRMDIVGEVRVFYPRYVAYPRRILFGASGKRMYHGVRELARQMHGEQPFDLIHAHVALPDGYAAALLAEELGIPFVVTIHGQDVQQTVHWDPNSRAAVGFAVKTASRVIAVSNKLANLLHSYFGLADTAVTVIPNGVDFRKAADGSGSLEESGFARETSTILSVSNLIPTKGIDLNIRAVAMLKDKYPDLRYRVIGGGPSESHLRDLARQLGVEERVEFLGPVSHDRVFDYMKRCTIFSLPSWMEGFGAVYVEAMACGCPVVGVQGEGISDVVEHGRTGMLVQPKDVKSLVEALDYLLGNPDARTSIGRAGNQIVRDRYSWEQVAYMISTVYEEVLIV